MKPVKVCIISKYLFPHDTRLSQQVQSLADHGADVEVLCLRDNGQPRLERNGRVVIHRLMHKKSKEGFLGYLKSTILFGALAFYTLVQRSLFSDFRIIVVHTLPEFLVFIGIFHKIAGKTIVLDERDVTYELLSSRWHGRGEKSVRLAERGVEWLCMVFCDEVITASNCFKRSLARRGVDPGKIHVLVNTADTHIFKYDANRRMRKIRENARIIYHGTVSERFGILHAVEAMASVAKRIPGSTLHIYGYYDLSYRAKIDRAVDNLGLASSVTLHEAEQLEEIYRIIGTMDFGIVPYSSDSFMNCALSTKTFEYAAAGLPTAVSRLKSIEEMFDDKCLFYAEPDNPQSLADTIVSMCGDPVQCEIKRENAYRRFNNFSGDIVSHRYFSIMKKYLET